MSTLSPHDSKVINLPVQPLIRWLEEQVAEEPLLSESEALIKMGLGGRLLPDLRRQTIVSDLRIDSIGVKSGEIGLLTELYGEMLDEIYYGSGSNEADVQVREEAAGQDQRDAA